MIAFLPIARYRAEYQVASGRPFSTFEKLLLRAVQHGGNSLSDLAKTFGVHRRLIVEGLVTLMQAGWVSLGADNSQFVLTSSGQKACGDSAGLPPTIIVADRQQTVVVEKVTGQVARNNELDFYSRAKLRPLWHAGVALRKREVSNVVDPGLVAPLLPHQPTEWIRWIGPISVMSDDAAFAVIDVDVIAERITGIPRAWEALLLPECIDQVRRREQELAASGSEIQDEELRQFVRVVEDLPDADGETIDGDVVWTNVPLGSDNILKSESDHQSAFKNLFTEAVSYVAIATPSLGGEAVQLLPVLKTAIERGLLVNIMLGEMPSRNSKESWQVFEALKKLEYDSAREHTRGRLVLGG
jgi:hypothetical protein